LGWIYFVWIKGSVAKLRKHGSETSVSTKGGAFFDKLWEL
jgi:hypothetical protein